MKTALLIVLLASGMFALGVSPKANADPVNVLVFTGGQADQWRFTHTKHFGEHLIFGPRQLNAARVYYYKGLTDYPARFERYLQPIPDVQVRVVNLDREQPEVSLDEVDLLVLDDVRADAFESYQADAAAYVDRGGRLLVVAGQSMLGGEELQAAELPTLETALLIDPPNDFTPYERLPWTLYATESSWRDTPLQQRLPVQLLSQPDLVVYDRRAPAVGGTLLDVNVTAPGSFVNNVPLEELRLTGYHKVAAESDAQVLATIGPEQDPLVVRRDHVLVFAGHEMETAVRHNGQPSNASINNPQIDTEWTIPPFSREFMLAAACELLFDRQASLKAPREVLVGDELPVGVQSGARGTLHVEPIDADAWLEPIRLTVQVESEQTTVPTAQLPEGTYRVRFEQNDGDALSIAASPLVVRGRETLGITTPQHWTVDRASGGELSLKAHPNVDLDQLTVRMALRDQTGQVIAQDTTTLDDLVAGGEVEVAMSFAAALPAGDHRLEVALIHDGQVQRLISSPLAVVDPRGTPDSFVMIAGTQPSHPVFRDLRQAGLVMTAQTPSLPSMLPFLEQHGGIARAYGFQYPSLGPENRFLDWNGEPAGDFSWADPQFHEAWIQDVKQVGERLKGRLMNPVVLFDDEPKIPMKGGWEAAEAFTEQTGLQAPIPERRLDDQSYLDRWTQWEDFRVGLWASHYRRGTEALKEVDPRLQTAVVVEGMGKDIYAGFDPARSQAGVDIYWYHIYPLNEPMMMVAHALERGLSAMRAMGEEKPTWALLQNWANQADVPRVPSPQYIRAQYWMAIAHGAETVGFWPYTYGFWISPGSPGWQEIQAVTQQQRWLSPLLKELDPVREPIGLLYSTSQAGYDHLVGLTAERPQEHAAPWHTWHANEEAFFALKAAGLPFESVEESELIATDGNLPYKALVMSRVHYLRPEARQALQRFVTEHNGQIFIDESSKIDLADARVLPASMDQIFDLIFPAGGFDGWNRYKHRDDFAPIYEEHARVLREHLQAFDPQTVRVSSEGDVRWNTLSGNAVQYLFLVNDEVQTQNLEQFRDTVQDWRLAPAQWSDAVATVDLAGTPVVYDVIDHARVETSTQNSRTRWQATVPAAGGRMYALFTEAPHALQLSVPETVTAGETLSATVKLQTQAGSVLPADLPLTVYWQGQAVQHKALKDGQVEIQLLIDASTAAGTYPLKVLEPVTGLSQTVEVQIQPNASGRLLQITKN